MSRRSSEGEGVACATPDLRLSPNELHEMTKTFRAARENMLLPRAARLAYDLEQQRSILIRRLDEGATYGFATVEWEKSRYWWELFNALVDVNEALDLPEDEKSRLRFAAVKAIFHGEEVDGGNK